MCKLNNCPLNNHLCGKKNCVYKIDFLTAALNSNYTFGLASIWIQTKSLFSDIQLSALDHRLQWASLTDACERGLSGRQSIFINSVRHTTKKEECDKLLSIVFYILPPSLLSLSPWPRRRPPKYWVTNFSF